MVFYVIERTIFLMRYENLKRKNKGLFNWFVNDEHIVYLLDYQNAKYVYLQPLATVKKDTALIMIRSSEHSILGVIGYDDISPKPTEPEPLNVDNIPDLVKEDV